VSGREKRIQSEQEQSFRLYAVSARYPHHLAQQVPWSAVQQGVYECRRGSDVIRVLVAGQLPQSENNALVHLFSASEEQVRYGKEHYRIRLADTSTLLQGIFEQSRREGLNMPYTMEDFRRDDVREHLKDLTAEERVKDLTAEELLAAVPGEKRVAGLSLEERLAGLSPEEIAELLKQLKSTLPPPAAAE
jgi:hypothetical protein